MKRILSISTGSKIIWKIGTHPGISEKMKVWLNLEIPLQRGMK
jgi:hypothetical protein